MDKDKNKIRVFNLAAGIIMIAGGVVGGVFTRANAIAESAGSTDKLLFSLCIICVLLGGVVFAGGFIGRREKTDIRKLTIAGMMAALCYIGFAFLKIDLPVPGSAEKTAFHLGNVFCVLAAFILGGLWGGMAGAVGMGIGDLFGGYVTSAPKTVFLKLCIGLIAGLFGKRIFKIDEETNQTKLVVKTAISGAAAMLFNVVADPVVGYFYKTYLFGIPQDIAKTLAKLSGMTTLVNAVVAIFASTVIYLGVRPAVLRMKK